MITLSQFEEMLKKEWISYFPEQYRDSRVVIEDVSKANRPAERKVGIQRGTGPALLLPIAPCYEAVAKGAFAGSIFKKMAEEYQQREAEGKHIADKMQAVDICNYETVKDKIIFTLVNRKENADYLQDAAYLPFEDLAKVFYIRVDENVRIKVTNPMCSQWGVNLEELEKTARENMQEKLPPLLFNLEACPFPLTNARNCLAETGSLTGRLYNLTNAEFHLGAAVMFYPGVMEQIAQRMKEPFYILPSSVDDLMILPKREGITFSNVRDLVKNANREAVLSEDFLSDNVYCYDSKTKEIRMMHEDFAAEKPKRREREYER